MSKEGVYPHELCQEPDPVQGMATRSRRDFVADEPEDLVSDLWLAVVRAAEKFDLTSRVDQHLHRPRRQPGSGADDP